MSFIKIQKNKAEKPKKKGIRRIWKILLLFLLVAGVVGISFTSYVLSSGSKVFETGLSGGAELIKTIYGEKQKLKGEESDRVNVLLMGMGGAKHPGGLLTDSIMLLSIKPSQNKMALISVPRDLLVKIPDEGDAKINSGLASGYNRYLSKNCSKKSTDSCRDEALIAGAKKEVSLVSTVLDTPIDYYVLVEFTSFEKIIDQLGGIDVYVDKTLYDPYYPDKKMEGYEPFQIKEGQRHLDGATALKYARSRETTSDFDRAARQQKILQAVKDKALQAGVLANPKKVLDLVGTLGSSIRTNFTPAELPAFGEMIKPISRDNIYSKVFSTASGGELENYNNGLYYLRPKNGDYERIHAVVDNIFNDQYLFREEAKIEIQNAAKVNKTSINTLSKRLRDVYGYEITKVVTSKTSSDKTTIYDYTGGAKKNSIGFLAKLLDAEIVEKTKEKGITTDFTIVLGSDYITLK